MDNTDTMNLVSQTLMIVLTLSLPPILAATVIGLLVSLFQALTQIQEQTLGFILKLLAVIVTIFATAGWAGHTIFQFTLMIFDSFKDIG